MKKPATTAPGDGIITRTPLAGSRKVYVPGRLHDIRVAMREISVGDTLSVTPGKETLTANAPGSGRRDRESTLTRIVAATAGASGSPLTIFTLPGEYRAAALPAGL